MLNGGPNIMKLCKNCGHSDESHSNVDYRDHSILQYKRCMSWSDDCASNCDCMNWVKN